MDEVAPTLATSMLTATSLGDATWQYVLSERLRCAVDITQNPCVDRSVVHLVGKNRVSD